MFVMLLVIAMLAYNPHKAIHAALDSKYVTPIILAGLFIITGYIRHFLSPEPTLFNNFIQHGVISVIIYISIIIIKHAVPNAIEPVRWLTLLVAAISFGVGIPVALNNPFIVRDAKAAYIDSGLDSLYGFAASRGIGNYEMYYAFAIAWPVVAQWVYFQENRLAKMVGWGALFCLAIAVLLSTYTGAILLLVIGIGAWNAILMTQTGGHLKLYLLTWVVILALIIGPVIFEALQQSDAIKYAMDKASSLFEGIINEGFIEGDSTTRGRMIAITFDSFWQNPFLGGWGSGSRFFTGLHSSLFDSLTIFGLVGTSLWLGFLSYGWRKETPLSLANKGAGGTISWALCIIGGILNPTFYYSTILLMIWLYDEHHP